MNDTNNEALTRAYEEIRRIRDRHRTNKGIRLSDLGLSYGLTVRQHRINSGDWSGQPLVRHTLRDLYVHHEILSLPRIRWHLERHEELLSGVRPMYVCVHGNRGYVIDGCHRTGALILLGLNEFDYFTWDSDAVYGVTG